MASDDVRTLERGGIPPSTRRGYLQGSLILIVGNLLLLAAKAVATVLSGSSAIYADAANSAADVAYSLLLTMGLNLSLRPADAGHPHGHRRFESLVGLVIGAAMAVAGFAAARSGLEAWRAGRAPELEPLAIGVLLGAGLVKALMYTLLRRLGRATASPALEASAADNLADTVSSLLALVGIVGSQLVPVLDSIAAWIVALWILRSAWPVLRDSLKQITGGSVAPELSRAVLHAALDVPGVLHAEQVIVEQSGPAAYVDIHVMTEDDMPLVEVHQLSHRVREAIEALEGVEHAFVHVEPISHR